jgi:hypothetical protein
MTVNKTDQYRLTEIVDTWTAMVEAEAVRDHHQHDVDRMMAEAMDAGVSARTIARAIDVSHTNVVRRVQRHRNP